jgi:plasmid stabilization system protein ParE
MAGLKRSVIIDVSAQQTFTEAINYIRKDSFENAGKVKSLILKSLSGLINNPEKYPPDKYRTGNDGSYRAFEMYKFRITYHIPSTEIRVLRIRHTRMNPIIY